VTEQELNLYTEQEPTIVSIVPAQACYFERELEILKPKAILALGKIAWDAFLEILKQRGVIASRALYKFAHGAEAEVTAGFPRLFGVYHLSQQNTQTGRVTPAMYAAVLRRIRRFLEDRD